MAILRIRINRRALARFVLMVIVPLLIIGTGGYFYLTSGRYVSTEDAYLRADTVMIAPEVEGRITTIAVQENQPVHAGDVLFRIDPAPFQIAVDKASANLELVRNQLDAARADYQQRQVDLDKAQTDIAFYQREYQRNQRLAQNHNVSESALDQSRHNLDAAHLQEAMVKRQLQQVLAQFGGDPKQPDDRLPQYQQAKAALAQAKLDLEHTVITAPADGTIGRLAIQPGDYIKAGNTALALITNRYYVEANLKETDLTHVNQGQQATVEVDAYPDRVWHARIASLSPATGAEYSILPAQNATGNWVKVVQRVPVRLQLSAERGAPPLRAGMSVSVSIDTRWQRPLPGPVRDALAWVGADSQ